MSPQDAIQAHRAQVRQKQILDAATEVFAEHGFRAATIRQVAQRAGVSDGTIYNYFANKDALLLGLLERINESSERPQHFARAGEASFTSFTSAYLQHRMTLLKANLPLLQALLPELLVNDALRERYFQDIIAPTYRLAEASFATLQAEGVLEPVDPELLSRFMAGTVLGLSLLTMLGDQTAAARWDDFADLISKFVAESLVKKP